MIGYVLLGLLAMIGIGGMTGDASDDSDDADDLVNDETGTSGDDTLVGEGGPDILEGGDGDDHLIGNSASDHLFAGDGNDVSEGGSGNDLIFDDNGEDTLIGDSGDDLLVATGVVTADTVLDNIRTVFETQVIPEFTHDHLGVVSGDDPDNGADLVLGGDGDDVMFVGDGDTVVGGDGMDVTVVGAWAPHNEPVIVEDFVPGEDQLIYDYDEDEPLPEIEIEAQDGDAMVYVNGDLAILAVGSGETLTLNDIVLTNNAI